jgi:predicted SAM-dependent methyltransferase
MKTCLVACISVCTISMSTSEPIVLNPGSNSLEQLQRHGLVAQDQAIRLHLGCGQKKYPEYINIDFPDSEHTLQKTVAADAFADIRTLRFPAGSVTEIRSHHVFEHFDRPTALALLSAWYEWLALDGLLLIETPDFHKSIEMILDPAYSYEQKQSIIRHIFGSHEAAWALHYDGWYQEKFTYILTMLGFEIVTIEKSEWHLTASIAITARKVQHNEPEQTMKTVAKILSQALVDLSSDELTLFALWLEKYASAYQQQRVS